jgi:hypothetical protein
MQFRPLAEPPPRYFTPEEANALLPRVRALMSRATEHARRIRERMEALPAPGAAREDLAREIERLRDEAAACVAELRGLGVEVKGLDTGLVDFPALRNGEHVLLCWRVSEPRVEWWHPLKGGFAARQRVTAGPGVRWEWRN